LEPVNVCIISWFSICCFNLLLQIPNLCRYAAERATLHAVRAARHLQREYEDVLSLDGQAYMESGVDKAGLYTIV
jgi:hypothetical protein